MKLFDLFTHEEFDHAVQHGYITVRPHESLPLSIANYTDKATYDGVWNEVTLNCRGLIFDYKQNIIARGPRKFFNYGEPSAQVYPLVTPVRPTKKEDGSLGIYWEYQGQCGVATRGSFHSEQAEHASLLLEKGGLEQGEIVEIVYPGNRIVLDYKGEDALLLLGKVDVETGRITRFGAHQTVTLGEAIALPIPEGEEGYVLDILDGRGETIDHLKLKGEWYKTMHAAIFGLTEKKVWEALAAGTEKAFIASLPDEVQPWCHAVDTRLRTSSNQLKIAVIQAYLSLDDKLPRAELAKIIMEKYKPLAPAVFALSV